jgi:hypothetical protein
MHTILLSNGALTKCVETKPNLMKQKMIFEYNLETLEGAKRTWSAEHHTYKKK